MFKVILLILIVGCSSLKSFRSDIPDQDQDEEIEDTLTAKPVYSKNWFFCKENLCKGDTPLSVTKEIDTTYLICECINGTYRVTKLRKGMLR